eukprot:m.41477 g.41477  ORF g.41477 m.41477 type:complete len:89 (-) comp11829_c0_seq1:2523-2789(-)
MYLHDSISSLIVNPSWYSLSRWLFPSFLQSLSDQVTEEEAAAKDGLQSISPADSSNSCCRLACRQPPHVLCSRPAKLQRLQDVQRMPG